MNRTEESNSSLSTLLNPAFYVDEYLLAGYAIFAALGIPINLLIGGTIIFFQRFRSPRNITWVGVGASNVFVLIGFIIDAVYARFRGSSPWLNYLFELTTGLPLISLVLNLLLALLNRYFIIHHHLWYKRNVTSSLIVIGQIGSFLIFFFIAKSNCFLNPNEYQQDFSLGRMMPGMIVVIVLFVILFLVLCFSSKTKIIKQEDPHANTSRYQNVAVRFKKHAAKEPDDGNSAVAEHPEPIDGKQNADEEGGGEGVDTIALAIATKAPTSTQENCVITKDFTDENKTAVDGDSVHFIHIMGERVSMLDLEAAEIMFYSVKIYFALMLPGLIFSGILLTCYSISEDSISTSSIITWIPFYTHCLFLGIYSALFNPIAFVTYSPDFTTALTQKFSRRSRTIQNRAGRFG